MPVISNPRAGHLLNAIYTYYNRWANHDQSVRLSPDLYTRTEKIEMEFTSDFTWIEVQFAKKAVDEVIRYRKTPKWDYAMTFYLESGNAKQLFEENQALVAIFSDLEKVAEDLPEFLESPIEPETIPHLAPEDD